MRLYLVQHGKAVDKAMDPDRPLASQGVEDVEAVGMFLERLALDIPEMWHSGKLRAQQTADTLARYVAPRSVVKEHPGLAPKDPVGPIANKFEGRESGLLIAGHLPFLGRLAGLLLCDDENAEPVAFQMGGMVCLERSAGNVWSVRWMVTPEFVR